MSTIEATPNPPMSPVKVWINAARPKTLTAAIAPIAVGTALAFSHDALRWDAALVALLGAMLIQIGTNYANDLFDFLKGTDTAERLGPTRVTSAGMVTTRQMAVATALAFSLAFVVGLYLVAITGWPLLVLGLVCILCGVLYTGGPFPLAYNSLGDVFVFVFFGLIATAGTYYVQAQVVHPMALFYGVSVGALGTAILIVNNLRDRDGDRLSGKITTAVRLGPKRTRIFYVCALALGYAPAVLAPSLGLGPWTTLLALVTLPLAIKLVRAVWVTDGAALNAVLGRTAKLQLLTNLALAAGIALGAAL